MIGGDLSAYEFFRLVLGFLTSTAGGAVVLRLVIDRLAWPYVAYGQVDKEKPKRMLTTQLGMCERASYTAAILLGAPTWIGVWLAIKVGAQWKRWGEEKDRATYNVFLIGNLLSIFFGVIGAWVALGRVPNLGE